MVGRVFKYSETCIPLPPLSGAEDRFLLLLPRLSVKGRASSGFQLPLRSNPSHPESAAELAGRVLIDPVDPLRPSLRLSDPAGSCDECFILPAKRADSSARFREWEWLDGRPRLRSDEVIQIGGIS